MTGAHRRAWMHNDSAIALMNAARLGSAVTTSQLCADASETVPSRRLVPYDRTVTVPCRAADIQRQRGFTPGARADCGARSNANPWKRGSRQPETTTALSERATVLLVNLGTPAEPTPAAVREFLREFLSDPMVIDYPRWLWRPILEKMVLKRRPEAVAGLYRSIWWSDGSPLRVETGRMVERLDALLGGSRRVATAYRYGSPSIDAAMAQAVDQSAERILLVPLFPQRSATTTGSIERRAGEVANQLGIAKQSQLLTIPPDDEGYIEALAGRFRKAIENEPAPEHLVISFHGVPKRYERREGGIYSADCQRTAESLLHRLGWDRERASITFQSRFGPEPWIEPATAQVLRDLPRSGVREIAVIAPGFVTDGLETLEELGVRGRKSFMEAGGERFVLVPAASDADPLMRSLAHRIERALTRKPGGSSLPRPDPGRAGA